MKNFILALVIVGVTAVGLKALPAQALTANDIQAQIQALLAQINVLTAQLNALKGNDTSSQGVHSGGAPLVGTGIDPLPSKHRVCYLLSRNLGAGSQGDDVRGLQEYLHENGYLSVAPTGYYGPVTAGAVAKWQSSEGVSAIGSFGPMSRERLKIWCGGNQNGERFNASPTSGSAPLSVTFNTWLSGFRVNTISYTIDFGDGTSERAVNCPAPADACTGPGQNTHTYTQNGVYTATLTRTETSNCVPSEVTHCVSPSPTHTEVVGKVQINVGSSSGGNLSVSPSSGATPLAVQFTYTPQTDEIGQYYIGYDDGQAGVMTVNPIVCIRAPCISPSTSAHTYVAAGTYTATVSRHIACLYSNPRCMIAQPAPLAYVQVTVTGSSIDPANNPQCKAWDNGCNVCSRQYPGGPAMCTLRACASEGAQYPAPRCTSYFDSTSTNKPPVISSFSGPTTLALNTTGTWSIQASDPENQTLSYNISWGDQSNGEGIRSSAAPSSSFVQSSTFTHSYSSAGTYTVTLTVTDGSGESARTTTTVRVGSDSTACTMEYAPVCGRPYSYCPPTANCQQPLPITYGNRCMLNGAGATFVYEGACANSATGSSSDSSAVNGCSFSTTAVGSMCGGYYHCATGANYHYWSGTYSSSCIAGR